ncbi:MAG: hypothetical protein ACE5ER_11925, partial [Nitrospinaceae bacterium]
MFGHKLTKFSWVHFPGLLCLFLIPPSLVHGDEISDLKIQMQQIEKRIEALEGTAISEPRDATNPAPANKDMVMSLWNSADHWSDSASDS